MKIIGGIVAIIVIAGLGWLYMGKDTKTYEPVVENEGSQPPVTNTMPAMMADVIYTDSGFSPSEVIIPVNGTVTWKNESKVKMWVASAMHPTHDVYDGTTTKEHCKDGAATNGTFDQCIGIEPGKSWSYTFTKVGDWKYHDHITSGRYGTVKVEEVDEMVVTPADSSAH